LEYIIDSKIDIPFVIQDAENKFYSNLFVQPQRCWKRIENKILKEIIVATFISGMRGPFYFIWLKEGEKASIKLPRYTSVSASIKALKIGN
jgi:hypothetical protein